MVKVHARVSAARERLREAGLSPAEAGLGARLLAEHLLGWDAARFLTSADELEPDGFSDRYEPLVARRAAREPLAYIVGRQEFWNLSFDVSPDVLIPRASTEIIVEATLELLSDASPVTIADACTGSGCLAVALAYERRSARIVATDISGVALETARRNAVRHGVDSRIRFVRTDILESVRGPFDLIVGNPPYVLTGDRPGLQPEVREYEPAVALYGGADGLQLVTRLVGQASTRLRAGAYLMFEFGFGQDIAVERLISETPGLTMVGLRRDLQGIARTAIAKREP